MGSGWNGVANLECLRKKSPGDISRLWNVRGMDVRHLSSMT